MGRREGEREKDNIYIFQDKLLNEKPRNCDASKNGREGPPKSYSYIVLQNLSKSIFFRILEINQRFITFLRELIQEKWLNIHKNSELCGIFNLPSPTPFPQLCSSLENQQLCNQSENQHMVTLPSDKTACQTKINTKDK